MMKICTKCGKEKPEISFYRHNGKNGGRRNECKSCCNERSRQHRLNNIESIRQYDRDRSKEPERAAALRKRTDRWKKKYPEKYRAKQAVNNAVRDGRLAKPASCESCGEGGVIHGHHHDYDKPLEVVWLCPPCHSKEHENDNRDLL